MVKRRKSEIEEREKPDVKQEEPAKKHRKSSVTGTGKEPLSNVKRYGINEVLAAIGFIPETGDAFFEKLAKNWYARHRPARMLVTDDPEKSEEQFYYMIVDFVIQHGDAFWSREARGHLLNKGSNAYRPTNWRKGENISFLYPRDSVHRSSGVRNSTLEIRRTSIPLCQNYPYNYISDHNYNSLRTSNPQLRTTPLQPRFSPPTRANTAKHAEYQCLSWQQRML